MRLLSTLRSTLGVVVLLMAALLPVAARADATDDAVRRIGLQLNCPVCEGQSIADSNSGLAADMRSVIRTRVEAGATDRQILDEFVASYGDSILADPPKRGISLGVWVGPVLGLLIGAVLVFGLLRAWSARRANVQPAVLAVDPDVDDELARYRQELGT